MRQLLPEWHPQWGVLLAWPDPDTDWAGHLDEARRCYTTLIAAILEHERVLLVCRNAGQAIIARQYLTDAGAHLERLHLHEADYDDTWARDFGPIAVRQEGAVRLLDCQFTGWGGKFPARRDNALNAALPWQVPLERVELVLEGGAIDTDGHGTVLTTRHCLGNPNRNPRLDEAALEARLKQHLGASRIWWLNHGHLEGDDTDAHVDTLARFVNETTIAHVQCKDPADSHHAALSAMEAELQALAEQHQLTLVPLPMVEPQFSRDGERLPATYANFLITNHSILVPTYGTAEDAPALAALSAVAGPRRVVGIPCRVLIEQHGSLHCVTMQIPQGALAENEEG